MKHALLMVSLLAACSNPMMGAPVPGNDAGPLGDGASLADADVSDDASPPPHDGGGADAHLPALRDDALAPDWAWRQKVRHALDRSTLDEAFADAGYRPPAGTEIYAARVVEGVDGPAYVLYEAGGGAFSTDFWPASTIKVLSSLGALDHLRSRGFSGAATISFDTGFTDGLRAIYDRAIGVSSNVDYDRTVRIAGYDRLNDAFLTEDRGFPTTVIQRSYSGIGVRSSPGFTITEGGRSEYVPAASSSRDGCPPRFGNCTNLFELTEAVRRVVLHEEVTAAERFDLDPADVDGVTRALCRATPSFFEPGATRALGAAPRICHKPGWVPNIDCLDHGLVEDTATGARYLLAAAIPERAGRSDCRPASDVAEHALRRLAAERGGLPLQPDAGIPLTVQLDDLGDAAGRRAYRITVDAPGADAVELWTDGWPIGQSASGGPRFVIDYAFGSGGERLVAVRASLADGTPIGFRSFRAAIEPPG